MKYKMGDIVRENESENLYRFAYDFCDEGHSGFTELFNMDGSDYIIVSPSSLRENFEIVTPLDQFADHVEQFVPKHIDNKLLWLMTGLIEENGELLQILRQKEYKDQDIDINHLKEELGDILYYFTGILNKFNLTLDEIKLNNISKLNTRFPNGTYSIPDAIGKVDHE